MGEVAGERVGGSPKRGTGDQPMTGVRRHRLNGISFLGDAVDGLPIFSLKRYFLKLRHQDTISEHFQYYTKEAQ